MRTLRRTAGSFVAMLVVVLGVTACPHCDSASAAVLPRLAASNAALPPLPEVLAELRLARLPRISLQELGSTGTSTTHFQQYLDALADAARAAPVPGEVGAAVTRSNLEATLAGLSADKSLRQFVESQRTDPNTKADRVEQVRSITCRVVGAAKTAAAQAATQARTGEFVPKFDRVMTQVAAALSIDMTHRSVESLAVQQVQMVVADARSTFLSPDTVDDWGAAFVALNVSNATLCGKMLARTPAALTQPDTPTTTTTSSASTGSTDQARPPAEEPGDDEC